MSYREDYWKDAVGEALSDLGKFDLLSSDEMDKLGQAMADAAESQSMAFGWDVASSNRSAELRREQEQVKQELRRERNKVTCRECAGHGRLIYNTGPWAVNTGCSKCNGEGRHDP